MSGAGSDAGTDAGSDVVGLAGVQRWLSHQAEADVALELVCAEHPDPSRGAKGRTVVRLTGCALQLATHELVELLGLGARQVTVRLDGCSQVDAATAHLAPIVGVLRAGLVDRLALEGPEHAAARHRRPVLDAAAMPVSRRHLLGLAEPVARELPSSSADPHDRLVAAVRGVVAPTVELSALPGPTPHLVGGGCTACGVCVQACPAGALGLQHGAAGEGLAISTLLHRPATCTGCLRCVDLCPVDALAVAGQWSWGRLLVDDEAPVVTVTTALCARCSVRFPVASGERLCAVCTYRRSHPFGSTVPPGATLAPPVRDPSSP